MTDSLMDEFDRFLENVRPQDFDRTSAVVVIPQGYAGPAGFNRFVQRHLHDAERTFVERDGKVEPLLWLANAREERVFEADDDETIKDMFTRLHREAARMNATMVFIAMLLHAARQALPELDGLDSAAIRAAIKRGELRPFYGWYAEHRHGDNDPDRRSGLWELTEDGELGEREDGQPDYAPLFHSVLA